MLDVNLQVLCNTGQQVPVGNLARFGLVYEVLAIGELQVAQRQH